MKSNIFLPKTLRVGYQQRKDTYTGKLAYVIYVDNKGKVRKEASWQGWRDQKIDPTDFSNEPIEGFVLNKKVGGASESYGWNPRNTYARIYDPRGFEFEITIPNLLYLLENTNSIKGKGIEGKCIYGWDGADLVLIPEESPDYKQLVEYRDTLYDKEKITSKDIVLGGTYLTDKNESAIYLGRFEEIEASSYSRKLKQGESKGKKHWFYIQSRDKGHKWSTGIVSYPGLSKIIKTVDSTPAANYADLMDRLERDPRYSPYDSSKDEFIPVNADEIRDKTHLEVFFDYEGIKVTATLYYSAPNASHPEYVYLSRVERYGRAPEKDITLGTLSVLNVNSILLEKTNDYNYSISSWGWSNDRNRVYKHDAPLVATKKALQNLNLLGESRKPLRENEIPLSLEEVLQRFQLTKIQRYLQNGRPYEK